MNRGRKILEMTLLGQGSSNRNDFYIVNLLQTNEFVLVESKDLKPSEKPPLQIIMLNSKEYDAIILHKGKRDVLELLLEEIKEYEVIRRQFSKVAGISQGIQTENFTEEQFTQTEEYSTDIEVQPTNLNLEAEQWCNFNVIPSGELIQVSPASKSPSQDFAECYLSNLETEGTEFRPTEQLERSAVDVEMMLSDEEADEIQISHSDEDKSKSGKKNVQFCIFCQKRVVNLPRHLTSVHKTEKRVQDFLALDPKDPKRKVLQAAIRREGNAALNVLKRHEGKEVIPIKKGFGDLSSWVPCNNCGAFYSSKTMYRHYKVCSGKSVVPKNLLAISRGKLSLQQTIDMPDVLKTHIIPGMQEDEVTKNIINDKDIVEYGKMMCLRHASEITHHKNMIRQKMRTVSRLKITTMKLDPTINSLRDIFSPDKWNVFIEAVQECAHLHEESIEKKSPNVVTHLGLAMSNIAKDIKASCRVDEEGDYLRKLLQAWLDIYDRKFINTVGIWATKLALKKKWHQKQYQPIAEDIMKLNVYLKQIISKAKLKLMKTFNMSVWENLNKAAMLLLLIFNRKRIGEVKNITVDDFHRKEKIKKNTDIYMGLTETEKLMASRFFHVTIRGKLARGVPILIGIQVSAAIEKILELRSEAGVGPSNPFLFGKGEQGCFDASAALKEAAFACGAEAPELLTSTQLRKHIATVSQALNLTDSELKVLCRFLGHTKQTHMEFYRMPSDAVHTAKLSRLLMALDSGQISKYKGKSMDEIDIDVPMETLEEEEMLSGEPSTSRQTAQKTPTKRPALHQTPTKRPALHLTPTTPQSPIKRRVKWSTPEKKAMRTFFKKHLTNKTLPSFRECQEVKKQTSVLVSRKVHLIKAWVNNQNRKFFS